jgi:biopolymer transport protein TolQ
MTSLASVAYTAPFFGIIGTLVGILFSFRGTAGSRAAILAALASELSNALVPTGLGVLVALLAHWSRKHLLAKLNDFNVEMKTASLELVNELSRYAP